MKSLKRHLYRVVRNACLTFEKWNTLFVQIEAMLNSRQLCPFSSDPNDFTPLRPAHFLIGKPRLDKFQRIQALQQHFWMRWRKEYLAELQQRTKWHATKSDLNEG